MIEIFSGYLYKIYDREEPIIDLTDYNVFINKSIKGIYHTDVVVDVNRISLKTLGQTHVKYRKTFLDSSTND